MPSLYCKDIKKQDKYFQNDDRRGRIGRLFFANPLRRKDSIDTYDFHQKRVNISNSAKFSKEVSKNIFQKSPSRREEKKRVRRSGKEKIEYKNGKYQINSSDRFLSRPSLIPLNSFEMGFLFCVT